MKKPDIKNLMLSYIFKYCGTYFLVCIVFWRNYNHPLIIENFEVLRRYRTWCTYILSPATLKGQYNGIFLNKHAWESEGFIFAISNFLKDLRYLIIHFVPCPDSKQRTKKNKF